VDRIAAVAQRWKSIVVLAVLCACLFVPASAQATLVFTRNPLNPVVYAAADDGSGAIRIGAGAAPRVSPDGQMVVFFTNGNADRGRRMMVAPTSGGAPRVLATRWQNPFTFAWSPDATTVVTVFGPELGRQRLVAVDVVSGGMRTIARGYFNGVSFDPDGGELVYARARNENFPGKSDVYRVSLAGGAPVRITDDHRSLSPLWGPNGRIVFVKLLGQRRRRYGPKGDLFLMSPSGGGVRRLTHTKVGPLLFGLSPTDWSADGKRLLAEFGGQDTSYAVTVNPRTGAERTLTPQREVGFVGTALSADGSLVLGSLGGFEPGPGHEVVSIPYRGGKPTVLARNAAEPDWSR
jgi:Tol biopolymer transport system component